MPEDAAQPVIDLPLANRPPEEPRRPPVLRPEKPRGRGAQPLLAAIQSTTHLPSLLLLEVAWRWLFGVPALVLLYFYGTRLYGQIPPADIESIGPVLYDPLRLSTVLAGILLGLLPSLLELLVWLVPLLALCYVIASAVGRSLVLQRLGKLCPEIFSRAGSEASLRTSPASGGNLPAFAARMLAFQLLRVLTLAIATGLWFLAIRAGSIAAFSNLLDPNLVEFFIVVILSTLAMFTVWALVSWVLTIAPLLSLLEGRGIGSSLVRSLRLPGLTSQLVEINLVLGILKLALMVLAMVFSAMPLPFATEVGPAALTVWWLIGTALYLVVSDFFQLVRIVATMNLFTRWKASREAESDLF